MKQTIDEFGVQWVVKPKDPAMDKVRKLNKANFEYVVLPRTVFRTGIVPCGTTGQLTPDVLQWKPSSVAEVRLQDCVRFLCT